MFYPPDPASLNYCTLGGNIAENAGGPHGVKYGVTKDYVLGLEVVIPSGDVVRLGGKQIKNVTGYNLVQLFVGSEGTLGVITEATLRLLPKPPAKKVMLAIFDRLDDAAEAVAGIMAGGVIPSTLEIMDQKSINCVEDYLKLGLPRDAEAILLIEVDGMPAAVEAEAEVIGRICREKGVRSFQAAKDKKEEESLWKARRSISPAISAARPSKIGEDISVPRSAIPAMVREIQRIAKEFNLPIVIFGHAGDGNLHPNILTDRRDHKEMERVEQAIAAIFEASVKLGGTLSGEHGIGLSKLPYMDLAVSKQTMKLMADIKRALDPKNILNPGKIWRA
jgi:glycolate oxidase